MQTFAFGRTKMLGVVLALALSILVALPASAASYKGAFLVADTSGIAPNTDPNLINPWGISFSSTGDFWVSDNNSGFSTLYNTTGVPNALVVTIPSATGVGTGTPTGTVFNNTTGFVVTANGKSGVAQFLFDSEDGVITGWSPSVNMTAAVIAVNNSSSGAVYKAMELANNGTATFLYVCNFFSAKIEVYDQNFKPATLSGSFTDPHLPTGWAPHNIRNINGQMYVAYAKQNATKTDAVTGPGLGFIDVFDLNGNFIKRFAQKGKLNAPWGLALATANFGTFSNDLLIGNLGDGTINAFDPTTGAVLGTLSNAAGKPIRLPGLWGLMFGNGGQGGLKDTLYFTSGPSAYAHGRFGSITAQ
ncbi:MAG TPA: TIGR03118 family protein [Terriglobales bacterium]|nr:TIGR03118 family protein [Terriglobales bacterium]